MWMDRLLNSRTTTALALTAQFAERRHEVLVENAANIDTPDYQTKRLDVGEFHTALHDALRRAEEKQSTTLELRGSAQIATDASGQLRTMPVEEPAQNVLFHDGTNARLESLLGDVQKNAMMYNLAMTTLKGKFDGLMHAIRGRLA